jgi:hypothetical protein
MAVGGKDKWPLHFYTALLMMRILGKDGMQAVIEDKNGGFTNPEVLKAFQLYKDFTMLEPFQERLSCQFLPGSGRHISRRQDGFSPHGHLGFDGRSGQRNGQAGASE